MISCVRSGEHELVIKKSRFISYSYRISSRDDVKPTVDALKAEHKEARHVCYGFIADEKGDDFGYDDNGEPSGTAGKPVYSALASVDARKSLIVVVRYFGGIKLGAGGLTRAYRQSAAELIDKVGLVTVEKYGVYGLACDGETYKKASGVLRNIGCNVTDIVYGAGVTCTVCVPPDTDIARALNGLKVRLTDLGARYENCE